MQINNNKPPEKQEAVIKGQKTGAPGLKPGKGPAEKMGTGDKVELSGRAKEMAEMIAAVNKLPDIRTERVEAIGKAVSAGTYKIDAYNIASRMIDEMV